jgi:hypothetical protein
VPTLAEFMDYSIPEEEGVDGISFAPILRGDTSHAREWIAAYFGPFRMIRTKDWLMDGKGSIYDCRHGYTDHELKLVDQNSKNEHSYLIKEKLRDILDENLPLYDFSHDPQILKKWKAYQKRSGSKFIKRFKP